MIQILLMLNRVDEAEKIRIKHCRVIEEQIDCFEGQLGFDEEITERYSKLKAITLSKNVGYFWFCEFSHTSIMIEEKEEIIFKSHYSNIFSNCIERLGEFFDESELFWNEIYLVKDDGIYYLETSKGNILFC